MKLTYLEIHNFKRIDSFTHSFVDDLTNKVRPVTAIFGDNGSGKTTILQAIALILSMATWKTVSPSSFGWHGFQSERVGMKGNTYIRVDLRLNNDEIKATHDVYKIWRNSENRGKEGRNIVAPGKHQSISLVYENGQVRCTQGHAGFVQMRGRYYTKKILHINKEYRSYFHQIGDVFWFDQYRNLGSGIVDLDTESEVPTKEFHNWQAGVDRLREYLNNWYMFHHFSEIKSDQDFIVRLGEKFSTVFPGARFAGIEPRQGVTATPQAKDFFFLIERDGLKYDVAEMSSGEQAVFSVMYQFVWQEINRSVVLIDELEMHLHPPEQQMFLGALSKIGPDCQYIITSHSPYLYDVIPDSQKVRLEGGRKIQ